MRIMFELSHPAHVHFFKNTIWELVNRNHEVKIVARDKDLTFDLLKSYDLDFENLGVYSDLIRKLASIPLAGGKVFRVARQFRPDILTGWCSIYSTHVSSLIRKPFILFEDTEHAWEQHVLRIPFSSLICTSHAYSKDFGSKHYRYRGYEEMAYLHPEYFHPNPEVLEYLNLSPSDDFIVLRIVSWDATHDINEAGFAFRDSKKLREFIRFLEDYGTVILSQELRGHALNYKSLQKFRPDQIHSLLHYAKLYLGEGATMAAESALLGTPSIYVSSIQLGYISEMEKYGLIRTCQGVSQAQEVVKKLMASQSSQNHQHRRLENLFRRCGDLTESIVELLLSYPDIPSHFFRSTAQ